MANPLQQLALNARSAIRRFFTESSAIFAARLLQNANGFLLSIIILRKFGLEAAGSLTIASTMTVFLGTLCTCGLPFVFAHSTEPARTRNTIGLVTSCAAILLSIPVCAGFALLFGKNSADAWVILLLAMAGPFFAQTAIANSLLVLQSGAGDILFSPLGNLIGLIFGYALTDNFLAFCIILTVFRFVGSFATFRRLRVERASITTFTAHLRKGFHFLSADTIGLVAEQASILVASAILSRDSLGLYGLCRQIITVSDTPAYSSMVVWYPRACERPGETLPSLRRHMLSLGLMCAVVLALLSVPVGLWVYNVPDIAWLAPLAMISVPFRYLIGAYDVTIRALNAAGALRSLTLFRCLVVAVPPGGIFVAGLLGGIVGIVAQMILIALVARKIVQRALNAHGDVRSNADFVTVASY